MKTRTPNSRIIGIHGVVLVKVLVVVVVEVLVVVVEVVVVVVCLVGAGEVVIVEGVAFSLSRSLSLLPADRV